MRRRGRSAGPFDACELSVLDGLELVTRAQERGAPVCIGALPDAGVPLLLRELPVRTAGAQRATRPETLDTARQAIVVVAHRLVGMRGADAHVAQALL